MQLSTTEAVMSATLLVASLIFQLAASKTYAADSSPSFDCHKATTPDEKAICASDSLSKLDALVAAAYQTYSPRHQDKRSIGREILKVRQACGSDDTCILAVQYNAIEAYERRPPMWAASMRTKGFLRKATLAGSKGATNPSTSLPRAIGQCVSTRIAELNNRFGDSLANAEASSGSAVTYTNGGHQVSYDREYPLVNSRIGDDVIVCLMSKPRDCPPNDARGLFYFGLNLRTNQYWEMPDFQHVCGGA